MAKFYCNKEGCTDGPCQLTSTAAPRHCPTHAWDSLAAWQEEIDWEKAFNLLKESVMGGELRDLIDGWIKDKNVVVFKILDQCKK